MDVIKDTNSWKFECQRDEIAPLYWIDVQKGTEGQPTYALAGGGKGYANGCWTKNIPVKTNNYYEFTTHYFAQNVDDPLRTILSRIVWLDEQGKQITLAEYPETLPDVNPEGWHTIQQIYECPDMAVSARIELVYRWDADGSVHFTNAELKLVQPMATRKVKLATVHYIPTGKSTTKENLGWFVKFAEEAGKKGADMVCLPEGITQVRTGIPYVDVSESVPGPTTITLGRIAKKYRMYIIAGIYERDGDAVYNTAVLIGRDGKIAGKYRKVCLPRREIQRGLTPGESFPVFKTDFGKIGILICWDLVFPESARALALNGAEIIIMPIAGGMMELAVARVIENQVYLVSSSYGHNGMKSAILGLNGKILAEANDTQHVAVEQVELGQQKLWPSSALGDMKSRIVREMPPQKVNTK